MMKNREGIEIKVGQTKKLTIEIEVFVLTHDDLEINLEDMRLNYDTYSDGRYGFSEEMIGDGLGRKLRECIDANIRDLCDKVYGREMVQETPTCKTRKAAIEADRLSRKYSCSVNLSTMQLKLGDLNHEES